MFSQGDRVLWYGEPAEIVAVRGDRIWMTVAGQDVLTHAVLLAQHQLPPDKRSLIGPLRGAS